MRAPFFADPDVTLYLGDALETLAGLPDESVHLIVTSPPFFGLRDYGTGSWEGGDEGCDHAVRTTETRTKQLSSTTLSGGKATVGHAQEGYRDECARCGARRVDPQIGLEASPQEWADRIVAVFRECRRVLRRDGTMWVECGDSYASTGERRAGGWNGDGYYKADGTKNERPNVGQANGPRLALEGTGVKQKDLIGAPWLLAFALRADGWWLRGAYPWVKRNAMPESVRDRFTVCTSTVFQFARSPRYFFDGVAVSEPSAWERWGDQSVPKHEGTATAAGWIPAREVHEFTRSRERREEQDGVRGFSSGTPNFVNATGKWPRGIFDIPTEPNGLALCEACGAYWERGAPAKHCGVPVTAHYAAFPQALVERVVKAGTSERGVCGGCGAPWVRETEQEFVPLRDEQNHTGADDGFHRAAALPRHTPGAWKRETLGWRPSCACNADTRPATILDPFGGSGTSLLVARRLGRHAIGIELREAYARITENRLAQLSLLAEVAP